MSSSFGTKCLIFLLVAVGCYHSANAQVFALAQCPNVQVVSPFDADKYLGTWYNNRNYFAIFQAGLDCITANYAKNSDNITVTNTGFNIITRTKQIALGSARVVEPGKLNVYFPGSPSSQAPNYLILDTDYDSYAVVWSCSNLGPVSLRFAWILTRAQVPPTATVNKALAVFQGYAINVNKLKVTNQNNCPT
ncbi:apolipoprotein D-like [Daphnia pulex]|uniref:apolipoprotein D-like n=1 Tax=Daphnia pulex TaxID=6669 RepID=UPI001EDDC3AD|nr:apolipoprotein D-like [Daphnia pulex]